STTCSRPSSLQCGMAMPRPMAVEPSCSRSHRRWNNASGSGPPPALAHPPASARSTPAASAAARPGKIRCGSVSVSSVVGTAIGTSAGDGHSHNSAAALELRRDQPVVFVAPLVQHAQPVGVHVAEDHELEVAPLQLERRLLDAHTLYLSPPRLH